MQRAGAHAVESARAITVESVLDRIHVFRACDLVEQMAVVRALCAPDCPFMKDHPDVKLVVLDSMAFHFRHGQDDLGARLCPFAVLLWCSVAVLMLWVTRSALSLPLQECAHAS